jgi:hypothetical protein
MLDLETWGTGNDAVPVSLGACRFTADEIIDNFHVAIDPGSCVALGLKMDAGTLLWWMDRDRREALDRWLSMGKVDLASALVGFSDWVSIRQPVAIWGNGSTFDNIILRSAHAACGLEYPVRFWQDLCYRSMKQQTAIPIERSGIHHDALDDAISQARHLQAIWREQGARAVTIAKLTKEMQDYILPDSGISEHDFVNKVIGLLDPAPCDAALETE